MWLSVIVTSIETRMRRKEAMKDERKGQANARAQSFNGVIECCGCGRRLAFATLVREKDGDVLRIFGKIEGTTGSSRYRPLDKKGVEHTTEEYEEDGEYKIRHRFGCHSPKCKSRSGGRGLVSYIDQEELPEAGAYKKTRHTREHRDTTQPEA